MPVRPLFEARAVIGPYIDALVRNVEEAHSEYLEVCRPLAHKLDSRTKASAVRDLIVFRLRAWADATDGVQFFRSGQLCWIGFRSNWIVRVKMLDDRFAASVSPTEASIAFDRNVIPSSVQGSLLADQPATTLYLGWRTTENAPLQPDVALVCNNENAEPAWVWTLEGRSPPPALDLPVPVAPDRGEGGERRIRIPSAPAKREA